MHFENWKSKCKVPLKNLLISFSTPGYGSPLQMPVPVGSAPWPSNRGSCTTKARAMALTTLTKPTKNSLWGGLFKLPYKSLGPEKLAVDQF